jgi:hypothetical protein
VRKDEMESEIQFEHDGNTRGYKFHAHMQCFAAWESERKKAQSP